MMLAGLGVLTALTGFTAAFRGPRSHFWDRMTATALALGTIGVAGSTRRRRPRLAPSDLAIGLGSAALLYGVFQLGDRVARRVMPHGGAEIDSIYALRSERSSLELAARLAAVIGPAEEIFWRGFLQERLMDRYGRPAGMALAAAAYGGVHVVSGNLTLTAAAATAGAFWSALYAAGAPLAAVIASHVAWDVWIFMVAPTSRPNRD